ncbi:MAG: V-type ATP synthase subunit F [Clostridiales bacterium]|nr:V-type ATP synthase subunit F [Clostridiales bacterium]
MRFYLISDNVDTQKGMRLAGIEGVVVHGYDDVMRELDACMADNTLGIVLITEKLAEIVSVRLDGFRRDGHLPLVVIIPDRHGTQRSPDSITKYVRDAIGVKI